MNIKPITLLSTALFLFAPASALAEDRPDEVRVRGGLGLGGGFTPVPAGTASATAAAFALSGRIGVQFNHLFSLYYQNTGTWLGVGGAIFDYNAVVPNLTLAHKVDFGVGPSCDVLTVSGSGMGVIPGVHSRLAFNIGDDHDDHGNEPRRRGFSVGLDVHPSFGSGGVIVTSVVGVGYEWF